MFDRTPYTYSGDRLREVAFPLGGIGTGCVSLDGRGALRDWEIFGTPNKGCILQKTFGVLYCKPEGGKAQARVVQGPRQKEFIGDAMAKHPYGSGNFFKQGDALPCFRNVKFVGTFPFARVEMDDPNCPLKVELTAFSPFIPLDTRASSMPVACLTYKLTNTGDKPVEAAIAWSMTNPVGETCPATEADPDKAVNAYREGKNCKGLVFSNERFDAKSKHAGTVAVTTNWPNTSYSARWPGREWFDGLQHFWSVFAENGHLEPDLPNEPGPREPGSLGLFATVQPGESVELPFLISWSFPIYVKDWEECKGDCPTWTKHYATVWPTAFDAAEEFFEPGKDLRRRTEAFEEALFSSTLPTALLESVSATASILHTPTVERLPDGTFWAWEGCDGDVGCCCGSCSHVWNYALAQAYLFPEMQQSMRAAEYKYGFNCGPQGEKGAICFRIPLPLNAGTELWHAASDGQLGGIVQLYRDWRLAGDDEYLKRLWPGAKHALEYAWVMWDRDRDGLVDGDQHNTYDINFQGPNPLTQFFYLAALRAAEEMARYLGETSDADEYRRLFESGKAKAGKDIWNGEFYIQAYDCLRKDAPKYQHGVGCLADQVFGQLAAHVAGLGYLAEPEQIKKALESVFKYNFRDPLGDHVNLQRMYAVQDEGGLLLCSWPNGGRPEYPFPYSDEVWTGIEYQVATHMVYEGLIDEGLAIVAAIRKRYDGSRRNPYNEFECGSHYARAMAAWGLLVAMSGFHYDAASGKWAVAPRVSSGETFKSFFSTGRGWGTVSVENGKTTWNVIEGEM